MTDQEMKIQSEEETAVAPRTSLNGCWILDKTVEPWSMNEYLKVMDVDPLAIQAHEKGEIEHDTFHTIELDRHKLNIIKRSRVNNDLEVELLLNQESTQYLPPGSRLKIMLAQSEHPGHVCIQSSLQTVTGKASVVDTKRLVARADHTVEMIQELTITNEQSGKSHTTVRHFKPYAGIPPHLVPPPELPKP